MKEVLGFIQWQWRKWELWQKLYIAGLIMFVSAVLLPSPWSTYVGLVLMACALVWTFKWAIWDNLRASWFKYKQERNRLFKTIRNSDS